MSARLLLVPLLVALLAPAIAEARTVRVTSRDTGRTLVLHRGDRLDVHLGANPSTGYGWSVRRRPPAAVARITYSGYRAAEQPAGSPPRPGTPGVQRYVLRAVGAGTGRLVLAYDPPGTGGRAARVVSFRIRVG